MNTSCEQIVRMFHERRSAKSSVIQRMIEIRDLYNGDVTVPLPELDRNEKAAVANLTTQGLDQMAMRVPRCSRLLLMCRWSPARRSPRSTQE